MPRICSSVQCLLQKRQLKEEEDARKRQRELEQQSRGSAGASESPRGAPSAGSPPSQDTASRDAEIQRLREQEKVSIAHLAGTGDT